MGFTLTHDVDATTSSGSIPRRRRRGDEDGVKRLKARLSRDFVAAAIALRFLYTEALTGKRELVNEVLAISLEELSQTVVSLLAHHAAVVGGRPLGAAARAAQAPHRALQDGEAAGAMEMLLSVLRPVISFVSDEALEDALAIAAQSAAGRTGQARKDAGSEPASLDPAPRADALGPAPDASQGRRCEGRQTHHRQWGTLEAREWQFADTVLLTGESGSGKSTLLDAIQTLLTAAHQDLVQFNVGQDESTQNRRGGKEPRTLPAYALGQRPTGSSCASARPVMSALVFDASEGPGSTSRRSALVGVEAQWTAAGPGRQAAVLPAARRQPDAVASVVRATASIRAPLPLKEVLRPAPAAAGPADRAPVRFEGKDSYLQHLYGRLLGRKFVPEAGCHALRRAIVKAMAYREIGNVNELVRDEILDAHDFSRTSARCGS